VQQTTPLHCPCGSGLSRARCCALDLATLGVSEAHRHLAPLEEQAAQAHQAGDVATAERLALDVLELAPGRIGPLSVLFEIRRAQAQAGAQQQAQAAEALIRRVVTLTPNNFWAVNQITLLMLGKGDIAEAELHARNAMRIAPENAQSHYLMGMVMTEAQRPAVGEYHYEQAIAFSGARDPVLLSNYALCLKNQGKMHAARALYAESLAAMPENLHTLLGFARLEEADRNLDAAMALLDRAEAVSPDNPSVILLRAVVLGRRRDAAAALALLEALEAGEGELGPGEYLEKGRLLDQMGRYDQAFAAFTEGKARLRAISGHEYMAAYASANAARLRGFFVSRRMAMLPRARRRADMAQPLFIVGFPRSGTTLLEQTLTAHARIAAGDELPIIAELTNLMPRMLDSPLGYPEALAELWMGDHRDDLDNLRDHYLRKVAQLGIVPEGAAWFTDKMPLNEVNLGLIAMLFPDSPVLHLTRHPLDVVVSVFSNLLTHGHYCAYALDSIAQHYVLAMDLVAHYRREVDVRYMAVRYEDIVDDQEATIRRVMAFVGEAFDPACLNFHENTRYARTASYAQVSEKLYDRSRYRYRHYLSELEPVIPILQPVIERLGYSV
jgi:tetratricopeptide (TPR) repeat protein